MLIYHLVPKQDWQEAKLRGFYAPSSLATEGFIHASTASQIVPIANQFYRGVSGLLVLKLDPKRLKAEVRFEDPSPPVPGFLEGELFPHIYGSIGVGEVEDVVALEPGQESGLFVLPEGGF